MGTCNIGVDSFTEKFEEFLIGLAGEGEVRAGTVAEAWNRIAEKHGMPEFMGWYWNQYFLDRPDEANKDESDPYFVNPMDEAAAEIMAQWMTRNDTDWDELNEED